MLFDLRSRGRRRTVQVVYLGLALLMGGGLVLFGVGAGNGNGGLLNAFTGNGSSNRTRSSARRKTALKQTQKNLQPCGLGCPGGAAQNASSSGFNMQHQHLHRRGQEGAGQGHQPSGRGTSRWPRAPQRHRDLRRQRLRHPRPIRQRGLRLGGRRSDPTAVKSFECLAMTAYAATDPQGDLARRQAASPGAQGESQGGRGRIAPWLGQPSAYPGLLTAARSRGNIGGGAVSASW